MIRLEPNLRQRSERNELSAFHIQRITLLSTKSFHPFSGGGFQHFNCDGKVKYQRTYLASVSVSVPVSAPIAADFANLRTDPSLLHFASARTASFLH